MKLKLSPLPTLKLNKYWLPLNTNRAREQNRATRSKSAKESKAEKKRRLTMPNKKIYKVFGCLPYSWIVEPQIFSTSERSPESSGVSGPI
jgi:hypothetical protein